MTNSCQIFMLSAVQQRLFSAAEIIKQTFIKHFKIQQQQSNYLFRIYVYDENYADAYPVKYASAAQIGIVNNILNAVAMADSDSICSISTFDDLSKNSSKRSLSLSFFIFCTASIVCVSARALKILLLTTFHTLRW